MGDLSGSKKTSSSSSSNQQTTNNNIDRRQVVGEGAYGFASDTSNIEVTQTANITALDGGAIANANQLSQNALMANSEVLRKALDTVAGADATNGEGFSGLLGLADKLFTGAGNMLSKSQDATISQIDQINRAANDKTGSIDQKTIMVAVGVAGMVAVAFAMRRN